MSLQVGWCLNVREAGAAYEPPSRFIPPKDPSKSGRGFLSCPAVRSYFDGVFQIRSPFSLRLRCVKKGDGISLMPVFPFTTLTEQKFHELITIEPFDTWRSPQIVALQFPSPYIFFTDSPATIEQFHPDLMTPASMNWRLIPGKFDIYAWQRPLNWAIEWDTNLGDLVIRAGDPIYFIKFFDMSSQSQDIELVECELTGALEERLNQSRGITGIRKGIFPLIKKSGEARSDITLIKTK